MFCAKCGAKLEEHAKFCNKCGNPVSASADGGQTAGAAKKQGKGPLAAVVILAVVLAAGAGIFGYQAAHKRDADIQEATENVDIQEAEENVDVAVEEVQPETEAEEQRDEKAELLAVLENISYYGDKSQCAMTAEQATAYAQLIADGLAGKVKVPENVAGRVVQDTVFWDTPYGIQNIWDDGIYMTDRSNIMLADLAGDGNPYLYVYSSLTEGSFELYGWDGSTITLATNWEGNDGRVRAYLLEDSDGIAKMFVVSSSGAENNRVEIYSFTDGTAEMSYSLEVINEININHCIENGVDTIYSAENYDVIDEKMKKANPELWGGESLTTPAVWFYGKLQPSTLSDMMEGLNQYAACIVGEDGEENGDDTGDPAAMDREAVLEQYHQFLQGDLTAEFEGNQVTFGGLYNIYCEDEYYRGRISQCHTYREFRIDRCGDG